MRKTNVYDTDSHYYTCHYCYILYVPKRRRVQKYCSTSCRSNAHQAQKKLTLCKEVTGKVGPPEKEGSHPTEKMSLAGVGNAAAGTVTANLLTHLLTKEENRPATKADLQKIMQRLQRYHRIENMNKDPFGRAPYFDLHKNELVYLLEPINY